MRFQLKTESLCPNKVNQSVVCVLRAGYTAGDREPLYTLLTSTHTRILVFSQTRVVRLTTQLDQGHLLEANTEDGKLWTAAWEPRRLQEGLHVLHVTVEDEFGDVTLKEHEFSLDGKGVDSPIIGRLVLMLDLIAFFQVEPNQMTN